MTTSPDTYIYKQNLKLVHLDSLPYCNSSVQCCGFQQWGSDKTQALMRAPPPAQERLFPTQTLQHSPNSPRFLLPQAVSLVMVELRQAKAELQNAKPTRVRSLSLSSSQSDLNHLPLHYQKTFVFLHPYPPPLQTVRGFNHLFERMFASSEVSTVMSPIQHTHTHIHYQTLIYSLPLVFPNISMPKTHTVAQRQTDRQREWERERLRLTTRLSTMTLSASCWWI